MQKAAAHTDSKTAHKYRDLYMAASAASVGLELALAVVIGWAVGYWLDGQLGTDPWMMLFFLCLGTTAGFKGVLRVARQAAHSGADSTGSTNSTDSTDSTDPTDSAADPLSEASQA